MAYTLRIPKSWANQLVIMCQTRDLNWNMVAGLIMQESSWNPEAKGDYVNGVAMSFGLGQIQEAAARDVGWTGTNTDELLNAELNITLTTAYLVKTKTWAQTYDSKGDIQLYGLEPCMLSIYNQGPGGFAKRGIAGNYETYVKPVMSWWEQIRDGGIIADDGSVIAPPADGTTPLPPTPPQEPPLPSLETLLSKYIQTVDKYTAAIKVARPTPDRWQFETLHGQVLQAVAIIIRGLYDDLVQWLGRLEG